MTFSRGVALGAVGMLFLALVACGGGEPESGEASTAARAAKAANLPGAAIFKIHCAVCHGETGKGDGAGAAALPVKPRDLTAEPYRFVDIAGSKSELDALVAYLEKGRLESGMPAFKGVLKDAQLREVAAYVAALRPRPNFVDEQTGGGAGEQGAGEQGQPAGG